MAEHDKAILRPILAHELLHARRGDTIVAALQALASCVWWHHPLIWWAVRESNRNTERCVDRGAITIPWVLGRDYARALMRVVELRTPPLPANGLVGLCSADITAERLRDVFAQLKRPAPRRAKVVKAQQWLLAIALAAAVLPTRPLVLFTAGEGVSRDCLPSADAADLSAALPESRDAR